MGELWWFAPRLVYEVDTSPHAMEFTWALTNDHLGRVDVEITARWKTADPVKVVAGRVFDAVATARPRIEERLGEGMRGVEWGSYRQLADALARATPDALDLPEGLRVDRIRATIPPFEYLDDLTEG